MIYQTTSGSSLCTIRKTLFTLLSALLVSTAFSAIPEKPAKEIIGSMERDKYAVIFYNNGTADLLAGPKDKRMLMARLGNITSADGKPLLHATIRLSKSIVDEPKNLVHVENVMTAVSKVAPAWPIVNISGGFPKDVSAVWTFQPESVYVVYTMPASWDLKNGNPLLPIEFNDNVKCVESIKPARWLQHPYGGVPYQQTAGMALKYLCGDNSMSIGIDGGFAELIQNNAINLKVQKVVKPWRTDSLEAAVAFDFGKQPTDIYRAVSVAGGDRVMLTVKSQQPFHIWDSLEKPMQLIAFAENLSEKSENVDINVEARTIDGKVILQTNNRRKMASFEAWEQPIEIIVKEIGPVYVTVKAQEAYQTVTQELCIGVMPKRDFKDVENSRFGMASYACDAPWHTDSRPEEQILGLMRWMGVRWLRAARDRQLAHKMGIYTWYMNGPYGPDFGKYREGQPTWMNDAKNRENLLRGNIETTKKQGDVVFEWTNEWNLIDGDNRGVMAERYVKDWLLPADKLRKEIAPEIKIGGAVIANADLVYLQKIYDAGGWPAFDYLVFHACGLPKSPDYGPLGDYWCYVTTLRNMHVALRKFGAKPLWMTEFYAPTAPNLSINHNERIASQNMTLEVALAVAADVKGMMYHRFDDADYGQEIEDPFTAAEPVHRETYFGLVRRDWCPKAGVWAYQAAAWMFDGAKFVGDAKLADKNIHGLVFEGNRGRFAIIWSREEGYLTGERAHARVGYRRPWQEHWIVKTPLSLSSKSGELKIIDWLGRETIVKVDNGNKAKLELTGAPVYVIGADIKAYKGEFSKMFK